MRTTKSLTLTATDRQSIRYQLIHSFLEELPGTGRGELCSIYYYEVETIQDGRKVILKRPARLNKGFDFEVHVEKTNFGVKRRTSMPTHKVIYTDLDNKRQENPSEFDVVRDMIRQLYDCKQLSDDAIRKLTFRTGYPIEVILKSIKWLFIEQDITYWNWSGREMLYSHLKCL